MHIAAAVEKEDGSPHLSMRDVESGGAEFGGTGDAEGENPAERQGGQLHWKRRAICDPAELGEGLEMIAAGGFAGRVF